MRLVIERDQHAVKGLMGTDKGVSFTLRYQLELPPELLALVKRYRLEDYPLTWRTHQGSRFPDDTLGLLITGRSQTLQDVTTLVRNEQVIKEACDVLPKLFEIVQTFGGRDVIEYPRGPEAV